MRNTERKKKKKEESKIILKIQTEQQNKLTDKGGLYKTMLCPLSKPELFSFGQSQIAVYLPIKGTLKTIFWVL